MTTDPSFSPEELFDTICRFIILHQTAPSIEARVAAFIVRHTPSFAVRVMFCFIAVVMIWVILICCASILIRWRKGTLWFVRSVHKRDGAYFTPHVGSMFALTSIFSALGIGLLILYEINLWDGKVLPNPLIIQTMVWYPVWLGSFCMVWGAAIAALSLFNQPEVRNSTLGLENVKTIQMSSRIWNCLVLGLPFLVSSALITSDVYANTIANKLQARAREIFVRMESLKILASDSQQCFQSPPPTSTPTFSSVSDLFPLLLDLHHDSLNLTSSMQISFACWSLGGIINFLIWVPCFIIQLKIFKKQVDDENYFSPQPPSDKPSPLQISLPLELSGNPVVHLDSPNPAQHGQLRSKQPRKRSQTSISKNNSYRALIFSSLSYTIVTLGTLCLTLWGVISPDVVLKDGKVRMRFIGILLVLFAFYGVSINLGILYQAWSTSRELSKSTKSTTKKAKQFHFSFKSLRHKSEETA
ncbi:hypothetical protein PTTG_12240 [Puccinia triticina 1-1 BBBD Race 1]|uniref:Uncharacterized protein n=2 Tax=Puccinia triticina TaxID=208348 RepID=A0A180GJC6_PUCT1|nr:uncharacterized protein PtA15_3A435 [Puccinia triticina]OAV92765.1 hypothetical protein PTTG_12240 [Puccinia triticina 1-1 BBBD Race 1]WAQ83068.1 hypothetical protein PtA15_3A435 [Puccinia triticina]WAR53906.1 hypothetical protein PtB15_3B415 [Puccinia triticina]